jgi:branched-chain amino acid transport system permease protein
MAQFLTHLFNGLTLGAVYALIALSYTMVYGVLKLINFAYSGLFTIGAYAAIWGLGVAGINGGRTMTLVAIVAAVVGSILVGMVCSGVIGVMVERIAYRPLRLAPILAPLISALGMAQILQNGTQLVAGTAPQFYPPIVQGSGFSVGGTTVTPLQITIIVLAIVLMILLYGLVHRTRFGLQIQATAEDIQTARLMGIRTDRVIALVFLLGSALGGAAGVLYAIYYGTATTTMGYIPSIKAFTAAVLGGIGNIPGAMVGGFLLGVIESFGAGYLPQVTNGAIGSNYEDVFAFIILIIILTIKPTGLLGERVTR